MKNSRRNFIKATALTGAAVAIQPVPIFLTGMPSKKINVAVMGVRSRGDVLAQNFAQQPDTEVAYLCDVQQDYLDNCIANVSRLQKRVPKGEKDIRKILDDKDIDAIVIAAPDHWHAPAAIMGVKAGKHVYVEKPCSHNPREGELLVEAQRKYKRIIQMGNQRRSWSNVVEAMNELRGGIIGKVYFAKGWYANNRQPIGFGKEVPVPPGLDWDLWQGPAPRMPYRDNIHPYNWHWFWHWGTGEALNNGTHEIDVARWGMGVEYPVRVVASGGRYHYADDWEFPDTMVVTYDFEDGRTLTWEGRSCNISPIEGDGRGNIFHGEKGTMIVIGNGYKVISNENPGKVIKEVKNLGNTAGSSTNTASPAADLDGIHIHNFLDCIRNGQLNNSPVWDGQKSVLMCQLGNIAWKTGRVLNIDQRNGHIIGDREAMELWSREYAAGWEPTV
jgi:predicted dehydrogenase